MIIFEYRFYLIGMIEVGSVDVDSLMKVFKINIFELLNCLYNEDKFFFKFVVIIILIMLD